MFDLVGLDVGIDTRPVGSEVDDAKDRFGECLEHSLSQLEFAGDRNHRVNILGLDSRKCKPTARGHRNLDAVFVRYLDQILDRISKVNDNLSAVKEHFAAQQEKTE